MKNIHLLTLHSLSLPSFSKLSSLSLLTLKKGIIELFIIQAKAYDVLDHLLPPTDDDTSSSKTIDPALWTRIDNMVLSWIYGTIYLDLLHTIIEKDSLAAQA